MDFARGQRLEYAQFHRSRYRYRLLSIAVPLDTNPIFSSGCKRPTTVTVTDFVAKPIARPTPTPGHG